MKFDFENTRYCFSAVRTVTTIAGQAPVDAECHELIGKAHVYTENTDVFDCMLNQVRHSNPCSNTNLNSIDLDQCGK